MLRIVITEENLPAGMSFETAAEIINDALRWARYGQKWNLQKTGLKPVEVEK